ncbi:MAG TPA: hypothetical protein P5340_12835 [Defluviicoccus sp.]|nr:hypothetical protein [Defluviicoccus sp.]
MMIGTVDHVRLARVAIAQDDKAAGRHAHRQRLVATHGRIRHTLQPLE